MGRRRLNRLATIHLVLAPHASAAKSGVLVTVSPAIDSPLDKASLASESRVQLSQGPADGVAFCLVDKSVASVLVLAAAGTGVDTVLCFEVLTEIVYCHGLDVAADRVLHFHSVSRILKGYPLDSVAVLSDDKGGCCWDGTWCCA